MKKRILIIPPAMGYPGSRGDEALIFGIKDYFKGKVALSVLVGGKKNLEWKAFTKEGIKVYNVDEMHSYIKEYQELYVLGADVIDGGSQLHNSLEFFKLIEKFKLPTTIIGFSFNKKHFDKVIKRFKALPNDSKLFVRDPFSWKRFIAATGKKAKLVADVGFLLKQKKTKSSIIKWIKKQKSKGRVVLGVNINSNKLTKKIFQAYVEVLTTLEKVSIVLIPHDSRSFCGDLKAVKKIWKVLSGDLKKHTLKLDVLRAREIKYICKELDCAIAGRMHLSIACLAQTTPVICIAYQDKMEGLFSFFGIEHYTVQRKEVDKIKKLLPDLIKNRDKIRKKIKNNLPKVIKLAKKNFE